MYIFLEYIIEFILKNIEKRTLFPLKINFNFLSD